ncbi:uncharacterized protein LOC133792101 [Humulus lupulus]|uniref:uncharacterized protein LOC133792101 n=1 Tax=Humulus lupulus TaxID=3486 RepID=UPI002B410D21|nr:uncharacterized protein LOC133792101 [Humulus lupulus]
MVDAITKERDKLSYPHVLIEVSLQQDFPSCIEFEDEFGFNVTVGVMYEWKPIMCGHCKGMGHATKDYRRKESRKQQWIAKEEIQKPEEKKTEAAKTTVDGFQTTTKGWRVKAKESMAGPSTMNSFQALSDPKASTSAMTGESQNETTTQENQQIMVGELENTGGGEGLLFPMDRIICWNVRGINNQHKKNVVRQLIAHQRAGLIGLLETRVKAPKLGAFCSNQLIHLFVATVDNKHRFFTTFVYGFNDEEGRKSLWRSLQDLARVDPWVVLGDFNDILNRDERIGDRVRYNSNNDFINCVSCCQLEDVKYSGNFYTWSNKQQGSDKIYSKIDRVMANQAWMDRFTNAEAIFLNEGIFDHTPTVLTVHSDIPSGKKPFKYFWMWSSHPQYHQEVSRVWNQMVKGTKMYQVVSKLKDLKPIFKELNKRGFSEIHMADMEAKEKLNDCQNKMHRDPLNVDLQYQELEARRHYAGTLLGTQMDNRQPVKVSIMAHGPVLSRQQADFLSAEFTKEDIKDAVFSIPGIKAPGPDGYCSYFFQDNWELVGNEICEAITSFLHTGHLLKEINSTVITLIPKCKCHNTVSDYRPISCCNVLYKVAKKLICSRLKVILPDLVAQNQGGFIKGRIIAHNIMICQDLIRHYGRKSIRPNCMIKLDLQKAYDTMEWGFLEEMLQAFQFPAKFISLIMNCITTPRYSLMFNGSMHGFFAAKRGLRQGDPMSLAFCSWDGILE